MTELSPYLCCICIYKHFLLGGHGVIKTGSLVLGYVELGTSHAYLDVGQCSNRLGVLDNLDVATGIVFLTRSQPTL